MSTTSKDLIAQIQTAVQLQGGDIDEDTKAVAGTAFGKRLSIKGGVFRKYDSGKEVAAIEDRHLNVIFVKMSHTPARNYYAQAYKEGENISPVCWSSDTKTPDASVKVPQSRSCVECAQSVKGSSADGNGTACRLSWRTAVVLPNDPSGDILQLVLPATSVFGKEENGRWPFRSYVQMLAGNNISAGRVITKMMFDTKSATPKLLFQPVSAVPPEDVQAVLAQSKSALAEACVTLTVFESKKPKEGLAPAPAEAPKALTKQEEESIPDAAEIASMDPIPEPIVRGKADPKITPVAETDVSEIVKKWASKKAT